MDDNEWAPVGDGSIEKGCTMTHRTSGRQSPADPAARRYRRDREHEPTPPRLCEGYGPPPGGIRRDRETGQWFADFFDLKSGPVEHGPFATEEEARTLLADLLGDPAK